MSVNKMIVLGNVGAEPNVKTFDNGDSIVNFNVACTERWKNKESGEPQEKTTWVPVVVRGALAKIASNYIHKGNKVYLEGKFSTREFEKDDVKRYVSEMVVDAGGGRIELLEKASPTPAQSPAVNPVQDGFPSETPKDDLPF